MAISMPWFNFTPPALINQNKGVFGVNLGHLWNEMDRVRPWLDDLIQLYQDGVVQPIVDATFSFEEAAAAHHYIQDRKNFGKVILIP